MIKIACRGGKMMCQWMMTDEGQAGMIEATRVTDGSRYVAERARVWLTNDAPTVVTPALPVIDLRPVDN